MRLPVITLSLIVAAIAVALCPVASEWLVYDRSAILHGQIWRMFTGHWVHFSTSHLIFDSLVLGVAGWMIEVKRLPHFGRMCLIAPWLISGVLLVSEPQMEQYGGLSALATMAATYLALYGLRENGLWRWACLATLVGIGGKGTFELATGHMIFVSGGNGIKVCAASHICGAVVALGFYLRTKFVWDKSPSSLLRFDDRAIS